MNIWDFFKPPKRTLNKLNNFNYLPDGVFVLEFDGKIIDVNNKVLSLYNTTRFNILGRYFSEFIEDGTSILNKVITNKVSLSAKAKFDEEYAPSEDIYFEITASRNEETSRVYVIVRNITKKHKEHNVITEKYTVAKKIIDGKNEFLTSSSGSILSTLVSISGFSRALLDGMGGALSDKQQKYLNIINTSSKDLSYDLEKLFALFKLESNKPKYNYKVFDLINLIKSIERVYQKDITDKQLVFSLDYTGLTKRDCFLDGEIIEYILRCIMDIFIRFAGIGKCSLNIGHPPIDFLQTRDFECNDKETKENYVLLEAKITDLVFDISELANIFDAYFKTQTKRPIGLKATCALLKRYVTDFKGDIWVFSKPNFGTIFTIVLPLIEPDKIILNKQTADSENDEVEYNGESYSE